MSARSKANRRIRNGAEPGAEPGMPPATPAQALRTVTPERLRQSAHLVEVRDRSDNGAPLSLGVRVLDACPLDAYLRRGMLDPRQHDAGQWLARCFRRAVHQPSMVANYGERLGGGGGSDPMLDGRNTLWRVLLVTGLAEPGSAAAPLKTHSRIYETLPGTRARVVLTPAGHVALSVCGLEEWAGGTRNLAKLRTALDTLADHLRIGRTATEATRRA